MRHPRSFASAAALAGLLLLATGCGGVSASRSVSPATFLLPGIMQYDPRPVEPGPDDAVQPERHETFAG
ncbi:MAG TPA: hypothetical protein PKE47_12725 [Verrucomicrobiota bacterium]|nr:hypothetical protein [Verrucomicrobiota bacterium]